MGRLTRLMVTARCPAATTHPGHTELCMTAPVFCLKCSLSSISRRTSIPGGLSFPMGRSLSVIARLLSFQKNIVIPLSSFVALSGKYVRGTQTHCQVKATTRTRGPGCQGCVKSALVPGGDAITSALLSTAGLTCSGVAGASTT